MTRRQLSSGKRKPLLVQALIQRAMERKKAAHPGYSYRALARDLGVSPAFVTNLLKGRRAIPRARLERISQVLELDIHERKRLFESVLLEPFVEKAVFPAEKEDDAEPLLGRRSVADRPHDHLLSRWYYLAVLEGLALGSRPDALAVLGKRLGLTPAQLSEAVAALEAEGAATRDERGFAKRDPHYYIPTGRSRRAVRSFHEQMIRKALHELTSKIFDEDFHRRLITGFTFCAHKDDIGRLKEMIVEFLDKFARRAAGSDPTDIYQCNVQFFPLTESPRSKR